MKSRLPRLGALAPAVLGCAMAMAFALSGRVMLSAGPAASPQTDVAATAPAGAQGALAVFPGAEGFGTRTPAGRGGKVIAVTSLADSGPGTLRQALMEHGRRIIVFRVAGTIELKDLLYVNEPFVTVAGQTAPGDGICLKNAGIVILTNDVLIQHIRIRPGNTGKVTPENNDAVAILGRHGEVKGGAYNVVLDHVSASWGEDETVSTWFGPHDITISWSIISEALDKSRHSKERHSAGLLISDGSNNVTVHHCLLAHNDFRNPLIASGGTHEFGNNVVYNWGRIPAEVTEPGPGMFLNFIGNCFIPGPSSEATCREIVINLPRKHDLAGPKVYAEGNIGPHRQDTEADDWSVVGQGWHGGPAPEAFRSLTRFETAPVTYNDARAAMERVLAGAGASRPARDAVDERIVREVNARKGAIINSPSDAGGYPLLKTGTPPEDSDLDGMPDEWERKQGLNPHDPSDAAGDLDGNGYTNVEEYLHSLL